MNRSDAMEVIDAIENGMCKIAETHDIWQNELVYAMAQGVRLLLLDAMKGKKEVERQLTD